MEANSIAGGGYLMTTLLWLNSEYFLRECLDITFLCLPHVLYNALERVIQDL
jgi:hypothetical protein